MKVIFLDIDGVMNSEVLYLERHKKIFLKRVYWRIKKLVKKCLFIPETTSLNYKLPKNFYTFKYAFNRLKEESCNKKWKWLSNFCNDNNYKICISSTWKTNFMDLRELINNREIINDELQKNDLYWEKTFVMLGFNPGTYVGITSLKREDLRGTEIKNWLLQHPEVDNYAILDDDSDMLPEQIENGHFHHVDSYFGLTPNILYRIKRKTFKNERGTV